MPVKLVKKDKKDEENPLPVLTYVRRGVAVTKGNIATLLHEVIMVLNDNEPAPENVLNYEDVLPYP